MRTIVSAIGIFASLCASAAAANAETIALTCAPHDVGAPTGAAATPPTGAMTIAYSGAAAGTLTVKGPFGEMALPASIELREGTVEGVNDGKPYSAVGVRAAGPAKLLMPDKAAIEACVAAKLKPDDAKDADLAFMAAMSCTASAPPGANPVPVAASVEIALTAVAPGQWEVLTVDMKRTFAEPSALPGGALTVESDPRCEIVK
jgi:hypothetical protein